MRRNAVLAALVVALSSAAAGSGGRALAAATTPREVTISDFSYTPGTVVVQVGETIQWTNTTGGTKHTVTADDGVFDSNEVRVDGIDGGLSYSHVFTQTGRHTYQCTLHTPTHPGMTGTVVVEPATTSAERAAGHDASGGRAPSNSSHSSRAPVIGAAIVFVLLVAGAFVVGLRPSRRSPRSGGTPSS
jgi:plastocyanin